MDMFAVILVESILANLLLESLFETSPFLVIAVGGTVDDPTPFLVAYLAKALKITNFLFL
jgi:hypothetical protein